MKFLYTVIFILIHSNILSQTKQLEAQKTSQKIKIDGYLNETEWLKAPKAVDFLEVNPTEGKKPQFPTEVSILYNDYAIYVGAMLYDSAPDSILKQLGERDDQLNADNFKISFDTYDKKIDAFVFSVSASGVQGDSRYSDGSFNAVWHSHVKILENGWSVEMEIPFSAFRFPNTDSLIWNIQFEREIRRTRSQLQWSLVSKNFQNPINYWGKLTGLNAIKNPVRLQISPYLSTNYSLIDKTDEFGYGGGADLKFGLSEAFTLDMTLLPDFSQVQSDNQVKNLSAFEAVFQEQRPFFQEGVDLFNLGGLFYSRRIGGTPRAYSQVRKQLTENEIIQDNPSNSKLINVSKISGRTQNGTGIGFLNAVTNESYATILDTITREERKVLTDPLINYNILAIDQNLKNNSSVYLINLNTTRAKDFEDANVTAIGANLVNKTNSYSFNGILKYTQLEDTLRFDNLLSNNKTKDGTNYFLQASKIKGKFRAKLNSEHISPTYNPNDLGVNFRTNLRTHVVELKYNEYNPFWILNQLYNTGSFKLIQNYTTNKILRKEIAYNTFTTFSKSFHSIYFSMNALLGDGIDLFESRVSGQNFIMPGNFYSEFGVSSDYRRKLAIDADYGFTYSQKYYGPSLNQKLRIAPIIRFTDKFTLRPSFEAIKNQGDIGFSGYDTYGNPTYGRRNIKTITNVLSAKYLFLNNLSLTLRLRHYWSSGVYQYYGKLDSKGIIVRDHSSNQNSNFNFNALNIDLVFSWQVAPGSFLTIVYKNALINDQNILVSNYLENIERVLDENALHTLTMKFIYFFDWASMKRSNKTYR